MPNCHRCYKKYWRRPSLLRNVLNVKRRTPEKGIDICELPDDKNLKKIFSKYELPFLDQANSSSDLSQILTLQHSTPIPCLLRVDDTGGGRGGMCHPYSPPQPPGLCELVLVAYY